MKIVVEADWEITIKDDGTFTCKGKTGKLTSTELEQICYRLSEDCKIKFSSEPQDLLAKHAQDVMTLEEQSLELEVLRSQLKEVKELAGSSLEAKEKEFATLSAEYEQYKKEHADVDQALADYRKKVKNLELDLYEAKGDIEKLSGKSVHNEHSTS